jgi:hypothetical protein
MANAGDVKMIGAPGTDKVVPVNRWAPPPSPLRKWCSFAWKVPVITVPIGLGVIAAGTYMPEIEPLRIAQSDRGLFVVAGIFMTLWPTYAILSALPAAIAQKRKCVHAIAIEWFGYLCMATLPLLVIPLIWSLVGKKGIEIPTKSVPDGWFVPKSE